MKICKNCESEFNDTSKGKKRLYCTACNPYRRKATDRNKICVNCGAKFHDESSTARAKSCSDKCKKEWNTKAQARFRAKHPYKSTAIKGLPRECKICGKIFPDVTGLGTARMCSKECRAKNQRRMLRKNSAENRALRDNRDKTCIECGKAFFDSSRSIKLVCCSKACMAERNKKRWHVNQAELAKWEKKNASKKREKCRWCGKSILGRRYGDDERLCSMACENQVKRVNYEAHVEKHKDFEWHTSDISSVLDVDGHGLYTMGRV